MQLIKSTKVFILELLKLLRASSLSAKFDAK